MAFYREGFYVKAIKDYSQAIVLNPNKDIFDEIINADVHYNRGNAYYKKGLNKLCISDWKKAADLGNEEARQNLKKLFNIDY